LALRKSMRVYGAKAGAPAMPAALALLRARQGARVRVVAELKYDM
jgi:hypothetical protein